MKIALLSIFLSMFSVHVFAAESPCGLTALNLEAAIHQKFEVLGVKLGNELSAISWTISQTSDGKFVIVRKSYVASQDGEITDELLAIAECDTATKQYKLMSVNDSMPLVRLKLNY